MKTNYHEKETIKLLSSSYKSYHDLHILLEELGFKKEDEFYFIDRLDSAEPWQAISIMTARIFKDKIEFCRNEQDILNDGKWNEIWIEYLLASLPSEFIEKCVSECEKIANRFELEIMFNDVMIEGRGLERSLRKIADDLTTELDEPGSEGLGILISQKH